MEQTSDDTADACFKANCICDRVTGWPKQMANGWSQHIQAATIRDGYESRARGEIHMPRDWSHEEQLKHILSCPTDRTWRDFDWPWWTFVTLCALLGVGIMLGLSVLAGFIR